MLIEDGACSWVPQIRRDLQDWEIDDVTSIQGLLEGVNPRMGEEDNRVWVVFKYGQFIVKLCYQMYCISETATILWQHIWYSPTLSKVQFFLWTMAESCILTVDMLIKRGLIFRMFAYYACKVKNELPIFSSTVAWQVKCGPIFGMNLTWPG